MDISQRQFELLKGMLMSDGYANEVGRMEWSMINREFMEWFDEQLGDLSPGVRDITSQTTAYDEDEGRLFKSGTREHPDLERFSEWYTWPRRKKQFPSDLTLTPTSLKIWYAGDGCKREPEGSVRPTVVISNAMSIEDKEPAVDALEQEGLTPTIDDNEFRFDVETSEDFFDYVGEHVPGFEYKWP
ncbi:LAGLIDADG endonuclease [Haloarcula virus HVTV-2]|uniref:Homing endonuclease LAGLIDADG domain-containing protein n=1 Tax=Haloarcula vallismortis tailed virus 1 TaxID=1262528 RepID=L7TI66_9CAUD|nr:homing endonuclease with LAGLIDADG motif [Haloarcula vallismortis tailed virus 1]AGC34541.1 hypothetical protein HVTV1_173 [Haloarcula vallismortis tailed virus 1]UBF22982.1 LAGLIDADG endonuclease [Haloarcula virus HVTV-2]